MAKVKNNNKGFVSGVVRWLESALALSHAFERLLVDVAAAYVPLLAPVIPAYLAFHNLLFVLKMPLWVSIIGALVVEFLGFATITTVIQFMDFNATKNVEDPSAPFYPAASVAVFYLIVVLTVNVLLDQSEFIERFSKLLMSTLSVAGAVTISLRGQHSRRVDAKVIRDAKAEEERKTRDAEERKEKQRVADERRKNKQDLKVLELQTKLAESNGNSSKVSAKVSETTNKRSANFGKFRDWRHVPDDERLKIFQMRNDVRLVVKEYGVIERTGYNWIERAEKEFIDKLAAETQPPSASPSSPKSSADLGEEEREVQEVQGG